MNQVLKFTKDKNYEEKVIIMENTGSNGTRTNLNKGRIVEDVLIAVLGAIVVLSYTSLNESVGDLQSSVNGIQKDLVAVQKDVEYLKENVGSLNEDVKLLQNSVSSLEVRYDYLDNKMAGGSQNSENARLIAAGGPFINAIAGSIKSDKTIIHAAQTLLWNDNSEVIATSLDNSIEYTVNDLKNEKVIFTYMEDGEQVVFCGQYSENNRWDGNCIINRYRDGKLTFIMDAEYNDGTLLRYKYVFTDKDKNGIDRWYVADWKVEGEIISGSTTSYKNLKDDTPEISGNEITYKDMITVNSFCKEIESPVMGYYNGRFADGEYNDITGNAYLVELDEEGYVKYFYNGNIINGKEDDHTGNAWFIGWGYNNKDYYYYKGNFTDGNRDGELDGEKDKISNEKIDSIIKESIKGGGSFAWRKTDTK